jgi:hypothetical protein
MRLRCQNVRLRFVLAYIVASQLRDEVRVLRQDAALDRIALLPRHRRDVERIARLFVRGLLQLAPIDQLDVGDGRPRRFPRLLVLQPAARTAGKSSSNAAAGEVIAVMFLGVVIGLVIAHS